MKTSPHYRSTPRRFRRTTLLIVGCGDVGRRLALQLRARHPADRLRVVGTARSDAQVQALRAVGIVPLRADLDNRRSLRRLAPLARWMVDLAPPPNAGPTDPRTTRLIAAAASRADSGRRWVYISTTGVYGDCAGAQFDETRPVAPSTDRARRRVDAERRLRAAVTHGVANATILRVPGIYDSGERLPVERLKKGLPALRSQDDVFTNHIHAEDLAAIAWAAVFRGRPSRIIHAVDDTDLKMGDYFDCVADALALPRPPRVSREALAAMVSPVMLTFMSESRRLANARLKRELRAKLRFPTVADTLATIGKSLL